MAVLNITYNGLSADYPLDVDMNLTDGDVRRIAIEVGCCVFCRRPGHCCHCQLYLPALTLVKLINLFSFGASSLPAFTSLDGEDW